MVARNKLPRRLALKRRCDIQLVLRYGRRLSGEGFALRAKPAESFGYAILVSRRHGNAVTRNRIKRIFREAIRLNRSRLSHGVSLAVFPATDQRAPSFEAVNAEIGRIFKRLASRDSN